MLLAACAPACVPLGEDEGALTIWETQLTPEAAFPGVAGQAAAVSDRDGTALGIAIDGATPGAQHVWGIRLGTCAAPGLQIGPDGDYPVLVIDDAGSAATETRIGPRLSPAGPYHIAVRVGAADTSRVACGDLVAR